MSHFAIEPDTVAPVADSLHTVRADIEAACTLSAPDTGPTTELTAEAIANLAVACAAMAGGLDGLGDRVTAAMAAYRESDGDVTWIVDQTLVGLS
ncbi:ABC-type Zn2+ transport system substrate-binding protein/surface adhesin [Nocardioides daedukensis]|uniref:ABC-type Zn2+ transport system substrate-binding protein/surface adhesin n=1 Tax=Nocardioides daedukensis TaxID=634462 RepID=A0A7Y9UP22_9ACTN|nr:hypothetical protein [Nocardioides daedukensis]NYG59143.1 ABC-type Zn2+ transport system substrate-binding protein/surface adhesin [Nocardioides daedukensis]